MKNTRKLYDLDSHLQSFTAAVIRCEETAEGYGIVLDQTAFFPEGGGQPSDRGTLNDIPVFDVQELDGEILHMIGKPLSPGQTVHGKLDWDVRFSNMQQHSGEHIVSGLVHRLYGLDNVGFHMGSDAVTVDFNGLLTDAQLEEIESLANEAVVQNVSVTVAYPDAAELASMPYRSKKELTGAVRIVTVEGYDVCACCAPHVKKTGEIGLIKLMGSQRYKGGVRISMLCGFRALSDYRVKLNSVASISAMLSAKPDAVSDAVGKLQDENRQLHAAMTELQKRALAEKVFQLPADRPCICLFVEALEQPLMRFLANLLMDKFPGICGVFSAVSPSQFHYILGSQTEDVRPLGKELENAFQGRGGGSSSMVQGSVQGSAQAIEKFFYAHSSATHRS